MMMQSYKSDTDLDLIKIELDARSLHHHNSPSEMGKHLERYAEQALVLVAEVRRLQGILQQTEAADVCEHCAEGVG